MPATDAPPEALLEQELNHSYSIIENIVYSPVLSIAQLCMLCAPQRFEVWVYLGKFGLGEIFFLLVHESSVREGVFLYEVLSLSLEVNSSH